MIVVGPDFRPPPSFTPFSIAFLELWLNTLVRLDQEFGGVITLTSWFRDPMRNAQVGGVRGSLHQAGLAGDFTVQRSIISDAFCGLGSLVGLCREPPLFVYTNRFKALAPPFTQALREPNGSYHYELDLAAR